MTRRLTSSPRARNWETRRAATSSAICNRSGKGCERDPGKAMELYRKAEVIARRTCNPEDPQDQAVLASIDLRLAEQYERTAGGSAESYRYYRRAVESFESAVAAGLNWYGKTLDSARAGVLRTEGDGA